MQSDIPNSSISNRSLWAGRILSGLAILFMAFDGVIHILKIPPVVAGFGQLGYPLSAAIALGVIELVCVVLYAMPRTSILGAILLTGYLGGAIATQVRVGAPLLSTQLFPVYVALFVWGGLYLRDNGVRALIPLRH